MATPIWPFYGSTSDTVSSNQAMVGYLVRTERAWMALEIPTQRMLQGLGIEIAQCREENLGIAMSELAERIGLDRGFICLLENGKILPADITTVVWTRLKRIKGFNSKFDIPLA